MVYRSVSSRTRAKKKITILILARLSGKGRHTLEDGIENFRLLCHYPARMRKG